VYGSLCLLTKRLNSNRWLTRINSNPWKRRQKTLNKQPVQKEAKTLPFKCNYCNAPLLFYSMLDLTPKLKKQLAIQCAVSEANLQLKVQKCQNKDCNKTYIWIEKF
jgi:transcription elongation factor Elf1